MAIGVIGLGTRGMAAGERLLHRTAQDLLLYDPQGRRNPGLGTLCESGAEVLDRCETVLLALETASELCSLLGACRGFLKGGQILLSFTDTSPGLAHLLSNTLRREDTARYLDVGLLGSESLGEGSRLFVGGNGEAFSQAEPLLRCLSPHCHYVGPSGRGCAARLMGRAFCAQVQSAAQETAQLSKAFGLETFSSDEPLWKELLPVPLPPEDPHLAVDAALTAEMAHRADVPAEGLFAAAKRLSQNGPFC